jgi:uncharacterized membrane protein YhaH (DUF805 family)
MNGLMSLYTTTEGRIGRGRWWLGVIVLAVIVIIVTWIIDAILGVNMMPNLAAATDPAAQTAMLAGLQKATWVSLVIAILAAYPNIALGVKRRHDRDNNGMDVTVFIIIEIIYVLLPAIGIGMGNVIFSVVGVIFLIFAIYMLVVLGFLRGTAGPNQYGPDPLGGAA